jgi:hypothetical protein
MAIGEHRAFDGTREITFAAKNTNWGTIMSKISISTITCITAALLTSSLGCAPEPAKSSSKKTIAATAEKTASKPAPDAPVQAEKETANASKPTSGGKKSVSVKDPEVVEAAKFACTAEEAAMKAKGETKTIKLVEVTDAQSQVVEGVSYTLTLRVNVDGKDQTAEAVVWSRAWLKGDDKTKLTSWKFVEKK